MFGRKNSGSNQCCAKTSDVISYKAPSSGIGAYDLAQAIREVANAPEPVSGQPVLLLAEEGSIVNERDLPANVTVIYFKPTSGTPILHPIGY